LILYCLKGDVEVLMTKDHVIPIAKGGRDRLNNYQTLCIDCNRKKASSTAERVKKAKLKGR
ncbi:MAG: HNH endonuclease, partial [Proteobacteria bacterium]